MKLGPKLLSAFLAVGIIPFAIIGWLSLRTATSELELKAQDSLVAIRNVKKSAIERYFEHCRGQVLTFSQNKMVVDAMDEFSKVFKTAVEENEHTPEDITKFRQSVRNYYTQSFGTKYTEDNGGKAAPISQMFDSLDDETIAMQYHYISNNPEPLGEKENMNRASDKSQYSELHETIHPVVTSYLRKFGYYDIFLADAETGKIVYSVYKELDFGTSLSTGPYSRTNFGETFQEALAQGRAGNATYIAQKDYKQYIPSYDAPASFVGSPIMKDGKCIGVALMQMPIDRLNAIMTERAGMGKSGETYLVGQDNLMRSDSYLAPKTHSVSASFANPEEGKVDTTATKEALAGTTDFKIVIDYNGNPVLSAYMPVQVGDDTWALMAEIDEEEAFAPVVHLRNQLLLVGAIGAVAIVVLALLITRGITKPANQTALALKDIAQGEGDLTRRLTANTNDEIGDIAIWFNAFIERIQNMIKDLAQSAESLVGAASEMNSISLQVSSNSDQTSSQAEAVSASAQEVSTNAQSVATSADQMKSSISEIARNANKAASVASDASKTARSTTQTVSDLSSSSQEIGNIIDVINAIAEQTNLLALNATIEAARAGEAGKGFAVVANEVKDLSRKTGEATEEIRSMVDSIQSQSGNASEAINTISDVIAQIDSIQGSIAAAVEQQVSTTSEIARSVGEASAATEEIARNISSVDQVAKSTNESASQVSKSSDQLAMLGADLKAVVGQFKF